jgi:hypothetical protein
MNASLLVCVTLALFPGSGSKMDSAVGGISVGGGHGPVFDARQSLYLYSGGD